MDTEPTLHEHNIVDLPIELFGPIIQHLSEDRKDLCAISLVCKIFQDEGQRQLYRKMTFSPHTPSVHIRFLKCILDNNRLALLVQEYAQFNIAVYRRGTLWSYLCRGLRAMVNLQVFKFRALDGQPSAEILRGCIFHLRVLVWGNAGDEDNLSNFLLSQHDLRMLDIQGWAEDKRDLIPPSCCPQLRVLCGNQEVLETFLPGREIISLSWRSHSLILEDSSYRIDSLEHLLPYLSRIRFLSFGKSFNSPCIHPIFLYFPCVEVLRLELHSHDDLMLLSWLKELQILVISSISGSEDTPLPTNRRLKAISSIFEDCEKLKQVDLDLGLPDVYQTYRRTAESLEVQSTFTFWEEVNRRWQI